MKKERKQRKNQEEDKQCNRLSKGIYETKKKKKEKKESFAHLCMCYENSK